MKNILKVVLLASVFLPFNVSAEVVTESHKMAAKKLIPILRITSNAAEIKQQQIKNLTMEFAKSTCVTIQELEAIRGEIGAEMQFSDIEPYYVDVLTREFSEAEIKKMSIFYATPAGQKSLQKLPFLEGVVAFEAQTVIARRGDAINRKFIEAATKNYNADGSCKNSGQNVETNKIVPNQK